jgi:hypothetical protein
MKLRLSIKTPKRPLRPGIAVQALYRVHVGALGKTVSLKQFCDKAGISYASCRMRVECAGIVDYDSDKFHKIVVDMIRRKARSKRLRVHNCPHCRCVRVAENQDASAQTTANKPDVAGSPAAGDDVRQVPIESGPAEPESRAG